jgi:hypothetical protein
MGHPPWRPVLARWSWNEHEVRELFFCPDRTTPRLVRQVTVRDASGSGREVRLRTGVRHQAIERTLSIPAGTEAQTWFVYTLEPFARTVAIDVASQDPLQPEACHYWSAGTRASFNHALLDRMFDASRYQLPAVMSAGGRVDASIWQYNREWVRDQAFVALGLLFAGRRSEAAIILERLIREFVTDDGATVDSSEVRSRDEVELDQNGVLLHALHQYVLWTGDLPLVSRAWDRVAKVAGIRSDPSSSTSRAACSATCGSSGSGIGCRDRTRPGARAPGVCLCRPLQRRLTGQLLSRETETTRWEAAGRRLLGAVLTHRARLTDHRGLISARDSTARQERIVPVAGSGFPSVPLARAGNIC